MILFLHHAGYAVPKLRSLSGQHNYDAYIIMLPTFEKVSTYDALKYCLGRQLPHLESQNQKYIVHIEFSTRSV